MRNGIYLLGVLALLFSALEIRAMPIDFGMARDFNAFVLGDMNAQNSDVEGRLAVAGNLALRDYSVGMQLSNSNGTRDDLVVGGQTDFKNGRIYNGNARSNDTTNPFDNSVGFYSNDPKTPNGSFIPGNPIDFQAAANHLSGLSSALSGLSQSGSKTLNQYGELFLSGSAGLNVFTLTDGELANVSAFYIDAPSNANVVVNVSGQSVELSNFGFFRNGVRIPDNNGAIRHDGSQTQGVLFNFFDALNLDIFAIGVKASVLAPQALVNFYDSHIDGQLIAGSFRGGSSQDLSGQINDYRFKNVAEPGALVLIIGFLLTTALLRKRRILAVPNAV